MKKIKHANVVKNSSMLFLMNLAKMAFPLVTLPYLTRALTAQAYGMAAYVKAVMGYMQILVDFGFSLSATKDVVMAKGDKGRLERVIGDALLGKALLGVFGFGILMFASASLPILRGSPLYAALSYVPVFASIFLMDFLFRGLERMHVITVRFILMKGISTALTFVMVKNDGDLFWIPILDILGSLAAVLLVFYEVRKLGLTLRVSGLGKAWRSIRESFVYFLSNVATNSFNALSILIIGARLGAGEVALWSVCMQAATAIQSCYIPISDGIYPEMVKSRDFGLILRTLRLFLPLVAIGCAAAYLFADVGMYILGGEEYLAAAPVFRRLTPVLFFGFPGVLFGWPALGAIGKAKEATASTVAAILFQAAILCALDLAGGFTLGNVAAARSATEALFFAMRLYFVWRHRGLFAGHGETGKGELE